MHSRRLVLLALLLTGVVGFALVVTAPQGGPVLNEVVSEQGLVTEIPDGWVQTEQFSFQWQPAVADSSEVFERWTVTRACGPDGCADRTLPEWIEVAERLPTFVQATEPDSGLTIVSDETGRDFRALRVATETGASIVYVAAFDDARSFYVECGAAIGVGGDDRLLDEIVDVCRATVPVGG